MKSKIILLFLLLFSLNAFGVERTVTYDTNTHISTSFVKFTSESNTYAGVPALSGTNIFTGPTNYFNGVIVVSNNILPSVSNQFDIGSQLLPFRHGYFSDSSIHIGNTILSVTNGNLQANGTNIVLNGGNTTNRLTYFGTNYLIVGEGASTNGLVGITPWQNSNSTITAFAKANTNGLTGLTPWQNSNSTITAFAKQNTNDLLGIPDFQTRTNFVTPGEMDSATGATLQAAMNYSDTKTNAPVIYTEKIYNNTGVLWADIDENGAWTLYDGLTGTKNVFCYSSEGNGKIKTYVDFEANDTNVIAAIGAVDAKVTAVSNIFWNGSVTNGGLDGYVLTWTNNGYAVMPVANANSALSLSGYNGVNQRYPATNMTGRTNGAYVVVATKDTAGREGWRCFDGVTNVPTGQWNSGTVTQDWVQIDMGTNLLVNYYKVVAGATYNTYAPRIWQLSGSTDGTNFTLIDSQTNQTSWAIAERRTFTPSPLPSAYRYFRFKVFTNNVGSLDCAVGELEYWAFIEGVNQLVPVVTVTGTTAYVSGSLIVGNTNVIAAIGDVDAKNTAVSNLVGGTNLPTLIHGYSNNTEAVLASLKNTPRYITESATPVLGNEVAIDNDTLISENNSLHLNRRFDENDEILSFAVAELLGYSIYDLAQGRTTVFTDEVGIDKGLTSNYTYNALGDYYVNNAIGEGDAYALDYDGSDDSCGFGNYPPLGFVGMSYTMSFWFFPKDNTEKCLLLKFDKPSQQGWMLMWHGDGIYCEKWGTPIGKHSTAVLSTGVWHNMFIVYDDSDQKEDWYFDGVLSDLQFNSCSLTHDITNGFDIAVGNGALAGANFIGKVDEINVWTNLLLTSNDMVYLYNSGVGRWATNSIYPWNTGLCFVAHFSEGSGTTPASSLPYVTNATWGGTPTWVSSSVANGEMVVKDMNLVSTNIPFDSSPSISRLLVDRMLVGSSITNNIDEQYWVSRNDGTNWVQVTMTNLMILSTNSRQNISGLTTNIGLHTGTQNMRWKITTPGQKEERFYKVHLGGN